MTYEEIHKKYIHWYNRGFNHSDMPSSGVLVMMGEALEKQIPKKPNYLTYDEVEFVDEREDTVLYPHCVDCGSPLDVEIDNYCPVCGQAVLWEEEE